MNVLIKLREEIKKSRIMFGTKKELILILLLAAMIIMQNLIYLYQDASCHQRLFIDANKNLEHSAKQPYKQPKSTYTKPNIQVINLGDVKKCSANIIFMILSAAFHTKRRQGIREN